MVQNPFYDLRLFDTGDHFDGTPALLTGFDIDLEHAFETLRPAHGSIALGDHVEEQQCRQRQQAAAEKAHV